MRKSFTTSVVAATTTLLLAMPTVMVLTGCGQKGALTLPSAAKPASAPVR